MFKTERSSVKQLLFSFLFLSVLFMTIFLPASTADDEAIDKKVTIAPGDHHSTELSVGEGHVLFKLNASDKIDIYLIKEKYYDDYLKNGTHSSFYENREVKEIDESEALELKSRSYFVIENPSDHNVTVDYYIYYASVGTTIFRGGLCFGTVLFIFGLLYYARKKWMGWVNKKADSIFSKDEEEDSKDSEKENNTLDKIDEVLEEG